MSELLKALQEMHEDGVLWRSRKIWKDAINPDAVVSATHDLVNTLLCIPNSQKRNTYIQRITDQITDEIKNITEQLELQEQQEKNLNKLIFKLQNKPKLKEAEEEQLTRAEEDLAKCLNSITTLKKCLCAPLSKSELTKSVKEQQEAIERKRRMELAKEDDSKFSASKQDLGLPADFDGNIKEVAKYQLYEWKRRYHSKRNDGIWDEVSNFTMKIIYFVQTGDDTAYRLIELTNWCDRKVIIKINTDDFTSVSSFKKILSRQGDFLFKGNDTDLSRLSEFLQKDEKPTKFVHVLGHNPRERFYAFANGVIDTSNPESGLSFMQADEYGIVSLNDKNYFLPALSKMYEDKEHMYGNEKRFVYMENRQVNFESWSKLHYTVYGTKGLIGQLWYILTLFMDIIYDIREIRCTPILFLAGQRGSGKGKYGDSLNVLFGYGQDPISLGSHSTPKGFMRKFAQFKNTFVWLDEFKNSIKKDFIEALKNIYDHLSYTRALKTTGFENESVPINSAGLVSGQEVPTGEPALYSRCILLQFEPGKNRTDEEKRNFKKLKDIEINGLSCITFEILKFRPAFLEGFSKKYDEKLALMYQKNDPGIDDRFIQNIAILAAIREVLDDKIVFPYSIEETERALISNLKDQFIIMQGNDDIGKFFEVLQLLVSQGIIRQNVHFRIDGNEIYIKLQDVHGLYYNELVKRRDPNPLPKSTLENYLKSDKEIYLDYGKQRVPKNSPVSYWCYSFRYNKLQEKYDIELSGYGNQNNNSLPQTPEQPEINTSAGSGWSGTTELELPL